MATVNKLNEVLQTVQAILAFDDIYELYANFVMKSEALRARPFDGQLLARPASDDGWVDAIRPSSKSRVIHLNNLSDKRREILLKIFKALFE